MKVLIIDDDANLRLITQVALEDIPQVSIREASSGRDGIAMVCEDHPDIVLLDMMMPGMDGKETLKGLRSAGFDGPVVFMTAKVQQVEVESYVNLGASAVICKPFDPMTLSQQIEAIYRNHASLK